MASAPWCREAAGPASPAILSSAAVRFTWLTFASADERRRWRPSSSTGRSPNARLEQRSKLGRYKMGRSWLYENRDEFSCFASTRG